MKNQRRYFLFSRIHPAVIGLTLYVMASLISFVSSAQQVGSAAKDSVQTGMIDMARIGYAVAPFSDTIFKVYNRAGSFLPQARAAAITKRIQKLAGEYYFGKDSLQLVQDEQDINIVFGESIIVSVSREDAMYMNTSRDLLAGQYKNKIAEAVIKYKKSIGFSSLIRHIFFALLLVIALIVGIYLTNKLFRFIRNKIAEQKGKRINGIGFRRYSFLNKEQHVELLFALTGLTKLIVRTLLIISAFLLLFGIFPPTKKFTDVIIGFIKTPVVQMLQNLLNYLPNLGTIIVIVTVSHFVLRGLRFLKKEIEKGALKIPGFHADWTNPTYQIIRVLVYAFQLVAVFPYLPGSGSPVFNSVTIFLGALFTLGSSTSLGNVISGLALTYMRSFKDGDRVKIGDVTGDIVEKNLLVTRVRTIKNEVISIPNSNVLNNHTINFSKDAPERGLILHTTITIGYDVPWKTVHALALKAALATKLVEAEPAPFIYQTSLDDFYVSYQVNAYTRSPNNQASIYSELHQNILDQFNQAGIEMLSPHYQAFRDGNMMVMPPGNLPQDYTIPAIRVTNVTG
jgi:small-conductance mechanosensitive channel